MPRLTPGQLGLLSGADPLGYAAVTDEYAEAGWATLPVIGKSEIDSGATGRAGTITDSKRRAWAGTPKWQRANVALRHNGTIAIDVDDHDGKHGATTLAQWVERFGKLPPTYSSTSRHATHPASRQYLFRVPEGTRLISAGDNIEICQHHHRYSVVWPSIHPDTGEQYRWFDPSGEEMDRPPRSADVPFLPDSWLAGLAAASQQEAQRGAAAPRSNRLSDLRSHPPKRGDGHTNDWLTTVAGHHARTHRADHDAYLAACRDDIALVDPNYEDFDKTTSSVWNKEQDKPPAISLDDSSLVDAVADLITGRWCWSGAHGWREWDGKVWAGRTDAAFTEKVRLILQEIYREESAATTDSRRASALGQLLSGGKVRGVAGLLRGAREVDSTGFDNHPELLNCNNGVVDLRTGELLPHEPALLLTKVTPADYREGARHDDWDRALGAVPNDTREWLQVRIGQAATGHRVTDELMPVLYGGGRNGKTTFLSSVQSALGSHARSVSDRVLTARDSDHPTELTDLQGLRLAVIEELPEAVPLSVKRLKDTVGQPTITARKIAKDTITWETTHALFLATNHKPRVTETDHGTWRRLALVRFPFVFDGGDGQDHLPGDPGLHDRMRRGDDGRAEAVLAWIVAGARRWYAAGQLFPPIPGRVTQDTEEWRGESDVIVAYIAERLRFDARAAVGTSDLLADVNAWLEAHGKAPWGDQLLTERFGTHERVTVHGVEKRLGRLPQAVTLFGRDSRELPRPREKARLWFGVAFLAGEDRQEGLPW